MDLQLLPALVSVCRLSPHARPQPPPKTAGLWSATFTEDECSVVCDAGAEPPEASVETGWRVLRVVGTLDFTLVGVLSDLSGALADAGVSIFALSTYNTDYLLVKDEDLSRAIIALAARGHTISDRDT